MNEMRRTGGAFVAWRDADAVLRFRALDRAATRTTIGRSPASAIALEWDSAVSALHAEIECIDDQWLVVDDGISTNGTFVAGRRVDGRARVHDQDWIVIGSTVLVFHSTRDPAVRPTLARYAVQRTDLSVNEFHVLRALCRPIVLDQARSPASNNAIRDEVFLTLDGVKRCLTRLYAAFDVATNSKAKRVELAHAAVNSGLIRRSSYG